MALFSKDDKDRIADAIRSAEAKTSGEIVAVVARESDNYRFIALLAAALVALLAPLFVIFVPQLTGWRFGFLGPDTIYLGQLLLFGGLALLFQLPAIRYAITPPAVKRERAHRNAVAQFIAQDLHTTKGRTGVLIFVSIAERYAEVIADSEIDLKVSDEVWQHAVDVLTREIGAGRPGDGFAAAITLCGEVLAQHFPPGPQNPDELPDHLIEL